MMHGCIADISWFFFLQAEKARIAEQKDAEIVAAGIAIVLQRFNNPQLSLPANFYQTYEDLLTKYNNGEQAAQGDAAADAMAKKTSDVPAAPMAGLHYPEATSADSSSINSSSKRNVAPASTCELTPEMEQELLQSNTICPLHRSRKGYRNGMGRLKAKAATAAKVKAANIAVAAQKPWSCPAGTVGHLKIAANASHAACDLSEPTHRVLPSYGARSATAAVSPLAAKGTAEWCKHALARQKSKQEMLLASKAALAAVVLDDEASMLSNPPNLPHDATSMGVQDESHVQHMEMLASVSSGVASHPIMMGVDDEWTVDGLPVGFEHNVEEPKKRASLLSRVVKAVVCSWW